MTQPPVDIVDRVGATVIEVDGDTCDARDCNARAFVYVRMLHGSLSFCGHHGTEYMPGLSRVALLIIDHRHHILA